MGRTALIDVIDTSVPIIVRNLWLLSYLHEMCIQ